MEKGKGRYRKPSPPLPIVIRGMPGPSRARIVSPRTYFQGRDCSSNSRKFDRIRKAELVEVAKWYPGYKSSMTISELCKLLGLGRISTPRQSPKRYKRVMQTKSGKCPSGYIRGKGRYCRKSPRKATPKRYKRVMQSPSGKCPTGYVRGKRRYCRKASVPKKRKSYAPPSPPGSPRRRSPSPEVRKVTHPFTGKEHDVSSETGKKILAYLAGTGAPPGTPPGAPRLGYQTLYEVHPEIEMDQPPGPPQLGVRRVEYEPRKSRK